MQYGILDWILEQREDFCGKIGEIQISFILYFLFFLYTLVINVNFSVLTRFIMM